MGRVRRTWLLWLAAVWLLWACCHVTAVMGQGQAQGQGQGQGVRRTADLRGGLLEPPSEPTPSGPRTTSTESLIPEASLAKIFQRGGMLMWPLLACSVVMMVFVFERAI